MLGVERKGNEGVLLTATTAIPAGTQIIVKVRHIQGGRIKVYIEADRIIDVARIDKEQTQQLIEARMSRKKEIARA